MIGATIFFILLLAMIATPVVMYINAKRKIAALAPGQRFTSLHQAGNPWTDESDVYTIVEVKNGWVRSTRGGTLAFDRTELEFVNSMIKID